jgi:hypothetical protein
MGVSLMMQILFVLPNVLVSSLLNAETKFSSTCSLICNLNMIEQSSSMKKILWMFTEDIGQWDF